MSTVPPSPPWAMMLIPSFLPVAMRAASMPLATADEFSKSECTHGTPHDEVGYGVVVTSRQPVLFAMMVFGPAASRTRRAASSSPQPAQPLCPGAKMRFPGSMYPSFREPGWVIYCTSGMMSWFSPTQMGPSTGSRNDLAFS